MFDHLRKQTITVALIGAGAVIIAAVIGIYPSLGDRKTDSAPKTGTAASGTVVDEVTNHGIGQATIAIAGRTEKYVTEDTGNFRIDFHDDAPKRVRLYVSKTGYQTLDTTVEPPIENLVLQLHRQ